MALTESFVKEHIDKWISAWNTHDLKAILFTLKTLNFAVLK